MEPFDLVIRAGTVATAADTVVCDIGVRDGRIAERSKLAEMQRVGDTA